MRDRESNPGLRGVWAQLRSQHLFPQSDTFSLPWPKASVHVRKHTGCDSVVCPVHWPERELCNHAPVGQVVTAQLGAHPADVTTKNEPERDKPQANESEQDSNHHSTSVAWRACAVKVPRCGACGDSDLFSAVLVKFCDAGRLEGACVVGAPRALLRVMNKTRRTMNYRSASTPATLKKQAAIRELLLLAGEGLTVAEIGRALGISRQLALYHVKKMAATYQLTMVLEPCLGNGGLQYKCWDEMALAAHYSRFLRQTPVPRQAVAA